MGNKLEFFKTYKSQKWTKQDFIICLYKSFHIKNCQICNISFWSIFRLCLQFCSYKRTNELRGDNKDLRHIFKKSTINNEVLKTFLVKN